MSTTIIQPYYSPELNNLYELFFCDRPELYNQEANKALGYPWDILAQQQASINDLQKIASDTNLESRLRLLACNLLSRRYHQPKQKEVLGVVVEVGLEGGLDTLAAYQDGTARYINYTGRVIIWETKTAESDQLIQNLFALSTELVQRIGPWDKERLAPPPQNYIRLSFLVTDGLYFGQGPFEDLRTDPMAAPVIDAATRLLIFLTSKP